MPDYSYWSTQTKLKKGCYDKTASIYIISLILISSLRILYIQEFNLCYYKILI